MPDSLAVERRNALERIAFDHYLRTGRRLDIEALAASMEAKFNPYHDPENGQFTTAARAGRGASSAGMGRSDTRANRAGRVAERSAQAAVRRRTPFSKNDGRPVPTLSALHNEIRALGVKVPPCTGNEGMDSS